MPHPCSHVAFACWDLAFHGSWDVGSWHAPASQENARPPPTPLHRTSRAILFMAQVLSGQSRGSGVECNPLLGWDLSALIIRNPNPHKGYGRTAFKHPLTIPSWEGWQKLNNTAEQNRTVAQREISPIESHRIEVWHIRMATVGVSEGMGKSMFCWSSYDCGKNKKEEQPGLKTYSYQLHKAKFLPFSDQKIQLESEAQDMSQTEDTSYTGVA